MRISVGTKCQLKLTILIFFYQICLKWVFPLKNRKIALVRASTVVTYYIKLFHTGADRHNGFLMSLLLLAAEKIIAFDSHLKSSSVSLSIVNIITLQPSTWKGQLWDSKVTFHRKSM